MALMPSIVSTVLLLATTAIFDLCRNVDGAFTTTSKKLALNRSYQQHNIYHRDEIFKRIVDALYARNEDIAEDIDDAEIFNHQFLERSKRWVIIVDDEEAIRMAVGDYLYNQGYQVTACSEADAMLEICARPNSEGDLPPIPDAIVRSVVTSCHFVTNLF